MEGKIVFEGKIKEGDTYTIRYPAKNDALLMQKYINSLSKERTFIRFQGEQLSLEEETKFLNAQLNKIEKHQSILLLLEYEKRVAGVSGIDLKDKSESHEGVFGISLIKEFRGQGIGKIFMDLTIDEAIKNISQLKLITLGVFGNNSLAIEIYKKAGFKEYGRLPKGSVHREKYVDHVYMYKQVRDI